MNRRGQTLILFVILIPILLGFAAFIVDVGMLTHEHLRLSKITKLALNYCSIENSQHENESKIKEIYIKNDMNVKNLEFIQTKNALRIKNDYQISSIFGSLIGIQEYTIKIDLVKEE